MNTNAVVSRGVRGFVWAVLALIGYSATAAINGLSSVPINLNDPKKTVISLAVCFVVGFLVALGKAFRDKYGDQNGGGLVNKLTP